MPNRRTVMQGAGDPNNARIPAWPAYSGERATMVFDATSRVVNDFRGDERTLLAGLKPADN